MPACQPQPRRRGMASSGTGTYLHVVIGGSSVYNMGRARGRLPRGKASSIRASSASVEQISGTCVVDHAPGARGLGDCGCATAVSQGTTARPAGLSRRERRRFAPARGLRSVFGPENCPCPNGLYATTATPCSSHQGITACSMALLQMIQNLVAGDPVCGRRSPMLPPGRAHRSCSLPRRVSPFRRSCSKAEIVSSSGWRPRQCKRSRSVCRFEAISDRSQASTVPRREAFSGRTSRPEKPRRVSVRSPRQPFLGRAGTVHFRGIDMRHAEIDSAPAEPPPRSRECRCCCTRSPDQSPARGAPQNRRGRRSIFILRSFSGRSGRRNGIAGTEPPPVVRSRSASSSRRRRSRTSTMSSFPHRSVVRASEMRLRSTSSRLILKTRPTVRAPAAHPPSHGLMPMRPVRMTSLFALGLILLSTRGPSAAEPGHWLKSMARST